jgi:hypothetical protein
MLLEVPKSSGLGKAASITTLGLGEKTLDSFLNYADQVGV